LLVEDKPLYEIRDGYIKIPDRPGLGLRFIPEALDKYTVKRELISSY
jgi:L-alanine-DL-glutamate epimerase-like enolase superfamily enzyme